MSAPVFFNLLANSTCSLAAGMTLIALFIWFFNVEVGTWRMYLLSLPFIKVVVDGARGLPADSILYSNVDLFSLPAKHQILSISAGFDSWKPVLSTAFSVQDLAGREYASSLGDYLYLWLRRIGGNSLPPVIVAVVVAVAGFLLIRRVRELRAFSKLRRRDRLTSVTLEPDSNLRMNKRKVDIYLSSGFSGSPFTGGWIKPYICFPQAARTLLSPEETNAVLAHELGHIEHFDYLTSLAIAALGDLLWFVPGYRALSRAIDGQREIAADRQVKKMGLKPEWLASALVKLAEVPETESQCLLYSALFRERSLLILRVERLLDEPRRSGRWGWQFHWARGLSVVAVTLLVLFSTLGGNQKAHGAEGLQMFDKAVEWILNSVK